MHWLCAHQLPDCETLYRQYWRGVVRFCAARLVNCPDGTAEDVAQEVFLAAHTALTAQRYRGDGALSTWLFGIASNLCAKTHRDILRKSVPAVVRQQEHAMAYATVPHMHSWPEREMQRWQIRVREAVHNQPAASLSLTEALPDAPAVMQESFQQLARQDRQAYTLLHMHVIKGASIRELAAWQGLSRSAVQRHLVRAKATLHAVYQARLRTVAPEVGRVWGGTAPVR
jgi:RNA polymerase sigma factor (sigma-70 family)